MNEPDEAPEEAEVSDAVTEARVRRSLGLSAHTPSSTGNAGHGGNASSGSGQSGNGMSGGVQRRRFVRDGEVPVVIVHPKSEAEARHAAALADLTRQRDTERTARLRAEQALHEAQAAIQTLQTRIAHAEMARTEAAAASLPTLSEPEATRPDLPTPDLLPANPQPPEIQPESDVSDRPRRAKLEKPSEPEEPTPVKWWR